MTTPVHYIIGIDLGTSASTVSYWPIHEPQAVPQILSIPQWESPDLIHREAKNLPSFVYEAQKSEYKKNQLKLPFYPEQENQEPYNFVVGRMAKQRMINSPERVSHSAKSWLTQNEVDREAPLLPWHSDTLVGHDRRSPVEVSSLFLRHIQYVWNEQFAEKNALFADQEIIITVPASFDETASHLTLKAAEQIGLQRNKLQLLEEPQAAFYFWLHAQDHDVPQLWQSFSSSTVNILVCDIGGGTTDFSLFRVDKKPKEWHITRIAVSDHILLGGDNIDLQIAYALESKAQQQGLATCDSEQWARLVHEARNIKEQALALGESDEPTTYHVSLSKKSSRLLAHSWSVSIDHQEILKLVCEGFFPYCSLQDQPESRPTALKEWGLHYAYDSAITKHLAAFIGSHRIDAVLYTGGSLNSANIQKRLTEQLIAWGHQSIQVLSNPRLFHSVSLGACYYARAQRRNTGLITSGYPRSLFLQVQSQTGENKYLCILPKGFIGHEPLVIDKIPLKAIIGQPVSFPLYSSSGQSQHQCGDLYSQKDLVFLAPLQTQLTPHSPDAHGQKQGLIDVILEVHLTSNRILQVYCIDQKQAHTPQNHKWLLHFNVQQTHQTQSQQGPPPEDDFPEQKTAHNLLASCFAKPKKNQPVLAAKGLVKELEATLKQKRHEWSLSTLRGFFPPLMSHMRRRSKSIEHECTWLNLTGFCLRPGTGAAGDRERIDQIWRIFAEGMSFAKSREVQSQWWIFWRRVAAGLKSEQQEQLFRKTYPLVKQQQATPEILMLLGALERVDTKKKLRLGQQLVQQIKSQDKNYLACKLHTLTRISSRAPLYGQAQNIIRPQTITQWGQELMAFSVHKKYQNHYQQFFLQSSRLLGNRELDIADSYRQQVLCKLRKERLSEEALKVLTDIVPLDAATQNHLFGENLPLGLIYD